MRLYLDTSVISPDFTIDDIHKIREYSYEITKDMTTEERTAYYRSASERVNNEINKIREVNNSKNGTKINY